jgi:hypothetical protein
MLDQRVLVTENVSDFAPLGRTEEHVGLGEQPMQWWLSAPPPR